MQLIPTQTLDSVLKTPGIAQDAGFDFDIPVPVAAGNNFGATRVRINSIIILSAENLAWEVWLWSKSAREGAGYDADSWLGRWSFVTTTDAVRKTGDAIYRYFIPDLDIPYVDEDAADGVNTTTGNLHLTIIPRGAAHVAGQDLVVKVTMVPEIAWD